MLPCYILLGIFVSLGDEHISVKGYVFSREGNTSYWDVCFFIRGTHITRNMDFRRGKTHNISLVKFVPFPRKDISLVICVRSAENTYIVISSLLPRKHISLVIFVSLPLVARMGMALHVLSLRSESALFNGKKLSKIVSHF